MAILPAADMAEPWTCPLALPLQQSGVSSFQNSHAEMRLGSKGLEPFKYGGSPALRWAPLQTCRMIRPDCSRLAWTQSPAEATADLMAAMFPLRGPARNAGCNHVRAMQVTSFARSNCLQACTGQQQGTSTGRRRACELPATSEIISAEHMIIPAH